MEKTYKNCQSCGMPLKKDENLKIKDGTAKYCTHCYNYDLKEFMDKDITVEEMKNKVMTMMTKEMKLPSFMAKMYSKKIYKLERWQESKQVTENKSI